MNDLIDITQQVNVNDINKKWEDVDRMCPDPDDVQYHVAAMELGCAVWSNDKRLKNQELVSVLNTEEVRMKLGDDNPDVVDEDEEGIEDQGTGEERSLQ